MKVIGLAQTTVKNDGTAKMRYTVTIMHGNNDCTGNNADVQTIELAPGGTKTISVTGEAIKSVTTVPQPL